ncbi:MAG: hypothetical protein VXZ40_04875 [Nanoarchaeota archaeon]|nr:hypothetical protein [Nanoarchaeota archaeon]
MDEKIIEKYLLQDSKGTTITQDQVSDILMINGNKKFFALAYERQQEPYLIYEKNQFDKFISENSYDPAISLEEETLLSITEEIKINFTKLKAFQLVITKEDSHKVLEKYKLYLIIKNEQ